MVLDVGAFLPPFAEEQGELELPEGPPLTPRSEAEQLESSLGASPSTPLANDYGGDCSPERTPGPGEGSPVAMGTIEGEFEECSIEVEGIVAEAEERSSRRSAAIRSVLAQLRGSSSDAFAHPVSQADLPPLPGARALKADAGDESQEQPLPRPRAHPPAPVPMPFSPPAPVPMPFSGGLGHQVAESSRAPANLGGAQPLTLPAPPEGRQAVGTAEAGEARQPTSPGAQARTLPAAPEGAALEQRRLVRHCGKLEKQLEQRQHMLNQTMTSLESEQIKAQEAHDSLNKAEGEVAYVQGMAAHRDAELHTELLSMRAGHQRERDRARSEARRMQNSLKEMQARMKAEVQARIVATEQAEALKEELATIRTDMKRQSREGQEAKAVFGTLEKHLQQYTELFKWVRERCTETLDDDAAREFQQGGSSGSDAIDGLKRIVGRTLTLLQRGPSCDIDCDKENKGNARSAPKSKKASAAAAEAAQRLATVQGELLNYEVENTELAARQRNMQDRLCETEEALSAAYKEVGFNPGLRTEQRGRLRAAEDGQRRMQKQLSQVQDELKWQYTRHEEEHERMRSRLSALQRAKEAGERYVETEEDTWIQAQRQERVLQSEYNCMRSEIKDAESDAREARADSAEARAALQIAAATKKRLEVELEEMQGAELPSTSRSTTHDHSLAIAAEARLEMETVEKLRTELAMLYEEANIADRRSQELTQETYLFRCKAAADEGHTEEWHAAADDARKEYQELQQALNEHTHSSKSREQELKDTLEKQRAQQAKIDEAKRVMVNNAMDEQEQTLTHEMSAVRARYEESLHELHDQYQEQKLQLDFSRKSLFFYEQCAQTLESELQQQSQDRLLQEQQICEFGRTELTAMAAQQEATLQARVDAVSSERTEQIVADAIASAKSKFNEELAHLHGTHAAAVAAVHGEYSGEIAAMRQSELARRDELAAARLACDAAEAAGGEATYLEEEKMRAAQRSIMEEAAALRSRGEKMRVELRKELWTESFIKARQEVYEEARRNPRNKLRQEISEQLRAEFRDDMQSELQSSRISTASGSPAQHKQSRGNTTGVGSTSGLGAGASPSSIGACSTLGSSPACMSGEPSSSCWPDRPDQPFKDSTPATSFTQGDGMSSSIALEETARPRRTGVSSAPISRQSSAAALDFREQVRPTGVFRQWTDPPGTGARPPGTSFNTLPLPPGIGEDLGAPYGGKIDASCSNISFKTSGTRPQPPPAFHRSSSATSFQEQAEAVLEMVSRSRAPFRAAGYPRHQHEPDRSLGHLPPWPGSS